MAVAFQNFVLSSCADGNAATNSSISHVGKAVYLEDENEIYDGTTVTDSKTSRRYKLR